MINGSSMHGVVPAGGNPAAAPFARLEAPLGELLDEAGRRSVEDTFARLEQAGLEISRRRTLLPARKVDAATLLATPGLDLRVAGRGMDAQPVEGLGDLAVLDALYGSGDRSGLKAPAVAAALSHLDALGVHFALEAWKQPNREMGAYGAWRHWNLPYSPDKGYVYGLDPARGTRTFLPEGQRAVEMDFWDYGGSSAGLPRERAALMLARLQGLGFRLSVEPILPSCETFSLDKHELCPATAREGWERLGRDWRPYVYVQYLDSPPLAFTESEVTSPGDLYRNTLKPLVDRGRLSKAEAWGLLARSMDLPEAIGGEAGAVGWLERLERMEKERGFYTHPDLAAAHGLDRLCRILQESPDLAPHVERLAAFVAAVDEQDAGRRFFQGGAGDERLQRMDLAVALKSAWQAEQTWKAWGDRPDRAGLVAAASRLAGAGIPPKDVPPVLEGVRGHRLDGDTLEQATGRLLDLRRKFPAAPAAELVEAYRAAVSGDGRHLEDRLAGLTRAAVTGTPLRQALDCLQSPPADPAAGQILAGAHEVWIAGIRLPFGPGAA